MISTGIYVRVSTEEQAKEGYSIRAQEEKLRQYATLKDWHIYSVYADEGRSGKDIDGRPAVKQLLNDVTSGKVNNVLVYKIDRLTRSTKNLIELVELFNNRNCAFNSLVESIDTASATGRMFLKIVGIFAEFERENLAERVRFGLERKVREGYSIITPTASFGYEKIIGEKIQGVVEVEAAIVRRVFSMYLNDDYSLNKIARVLNAEKIPTKNGKQWQNTTIRKMLENCNYTGKVRYGTKDANRYFEAQGHHEPILDEDIFYQVQDKLSKIKRVARTKRPTHEAYFCGVLYCPKCGNKYTSHWLYKKDSDGKRSMKYPNYRCINAFRGFCSNRTHLSHRKLELAFEDYIARYADFTAQRLNGDATDNLTAIDNTAEITAITGEIAQLERKAAEIMKLFATENLDFDAYQNMIRFNNERRGELEKRLDVLQSTENAKEIRYKKAEIITNIKNNWREINDHQRLQFVQKFIKKLVAHGEVPDGGYFINVIVDSIKFNEF